MAVRFQTAKVESNSSPQVGVLAVLRQAAQAARVDTGVIASIVSSSDWLSASAEAFLLIEERMVSNGDGDVADRMRRRLRLACGAVRDDPRIAFILEPREHRTTVIGERLVAAVQEQMSAGAASSVRGAPMVEDVTSVARWFASVRGEIGEDAAESLLVSARLDTMMTLPGGVTGEVEQWTRLLQHGISARNDGVPGSGQPQDPTSEEICALFHAAGAGAWEWDCTNDRLRVSGRWRVVGGVDAERAITAIGDWRLLIHPDDRVRFDDAVAGMLERGNGRFDCEYRIGTEGDWRAMSCRGAAIRDEKDRPLFIVGYVFTRLSPSIPMCEVCSRDRLMSMLARGLVTDEPVALVLLNIDRFRVINECFGYEAGDGLLKAIAGRIGTFVAAGGTVVRVCADEFATLVHIDTLDFFTAKPCPILDGICGRYEVAGQTVHISVSVGIAKARKEQAAESLLRDAETALRVAKNQGGRMVKVFSAPMRTEATTSMLFETDLREAIENHELFVEFQPIVNIEDRLVVGLEALVRWNHPARGRIPPREFIPSAEESGLILALGEWVLDRACSYMASWREVAAGELPYVSVNVSPRQLADDGFIHLLSRVMNRHGISSGQLAIEITESSLVDVGTSDAIQALRGMGVRVFIDDFGTGYSSLSYLHRRGFDALKIDRSFISCLSQGWSSQQIIKTIVQLSQSLGFDAIVEGVETESQLAFIRDIGCTTAQGFLFAPPLKLEHHEDPRRVFSATRSAVNVSTPR